MFVADENNFIVEKNTDSDYQIDPDEIYPWFKDTYKLLFENSTELIRWKKVIGYLDGQYELDTYTKMPDAKKEAKALLHEREDTIDNYKEENEGLKNKIIELQNMKSVFLSDAIKVRCCIKMG